MARHSHWASIRIKKGALDKKRGKIFTKHARLIEMAARKGGNPEMNPSLRLAIENARYENMPRENIERAIKKGTGELKEGAELHEATYEGFAPGGVALLIDVLTDNKNRANQAVRMAVQKNGGTLGSMGSTSFLFEAKGVIRVQAKGERDSDELELIDAGAEDIEEISDGGIGEFIVYTGAAQLGEVKKRLEEKGFKILSAEFQKVPKNLVEVSDPGVAQKIIALLEALDEEEDVTNVAMNGDLK